MVKKQPKAINNTQVYITKQKLSKRRIMVSSSVVLLLLVAVGLGLYINNRSSEQSTTTNSKLVAKIAKLSENGKCKDLDQIQQIDLNSYSFDAQVATLKYRMECNDYKKNQEASLVAAYKLQMLYENDKSHDNTNNLTYIKTVIDNLKAETNSASGQ